MKLLMEAKLDALKSHRGHKAHHNSLVGGEGRCAACIGCSVGVGGGFPKGSVSMRACSGVIECLMVKGGWRGGVGRGVRRFRSGYQTSTAVSVWKRAKMQEGQKTSPRRTLYLQEVKKSC